jgi:NAD(P)-dependent dehydrogenase (short-subunit alcohol dehydrogenase family)
VSVDVAGESTPPRVLVTGAAKGLGRAIVSELVDRGWIVWAADIDREALGDTPAQHAVAMDVTDGRQVADVIGAIDGVGGISALVNNAGIFPLQKWCDLTAETMRAVHDVNVVGPVICTTAAAESMVARGHPGAIVNVVSLAFHKGHRTGIAYASSKGALIGATRSFAQALGPYGIRVNALAPGFMETDGTRGLVASGAFPSVRLAATDPARALPGRTEPAAVARTVAALLGPDFADTTGQVVLADGGTYFV